MSNPYKLLKSLLPDPPLQVGTVTAVDGSTVTVQLPDGGTLQARAQIDLQVNDKVFVRDGVVEGEAPALTLEVIEV